MMAPRNFASPGRHRSPACCVYGNNARDSLGSEQL